MTVYVTALKRRAQKTEIVVYKGITFRRYPESGNWAERNYYRPGIADAMSGVESLHREIYKDYVGPIPEGYHIHHRDEDTSNNEPENLEALSPAAHGSRHKGRPMSAAQYEHLERVRPLTKVWHSSPEGFLLHSENGKKVWANAPIWSIVCANCGVLFQVKMLQNTARFCSNSCKSAWRRKAGVDLD